MMGPASLAGITLLLMASRGGSVEFLDYGAGGNVVVDDIGVVGPAPDLVAVLPADLAVAALERVDQADADPGARRVRAVGEAVAGDREVEDGVVEHPLLGGEAVQVGDLVDLHRAEDLQVLLLDLLLVAVHEPARRDLPHDVVGVDADREVDTLGVLVVEMLLDRRDVRGDDRFTVRDSLCHCASFGAVRLVSDATAKKIYSARPIAGGCWESCGWVLRGAGLTGLAGRRAGRGFGQRLKLRLWRQCRGRGRIGWRPGSATGTGQGPDIATPP